MWPNLRYYGQAFKHEQNYCNNHFSTKKLREFVILNYFRQSYVGSNFAIFLSKNSTFRQNFAGSAYCEKPFAQFVVTGNFHRILLSNQLSGPLKLVSLFPPKAKSTAFQRGISLG